jgi:NitT/TauT family transport system substrate-binding protein
MSGIALIGRRFGKAGSALAAAALFAGLATAPAAAEDTVREGIQIGALGTLRVTLPEVGKKFGIKYDIKNFGDSTAALRALDQGDLEIANTTVQHVARALAEKMAVVWVAGWGGGYNVLVAGKGFDAGSDDAALKAAIMKRKAAGKPVKIGVPTGSMQHAKLLQYLTSIGVDGDKDVQVVNVPFPVHPRALGAGEVDMAMTLAGFGALAIDKSGARLVKHIYGGPFGKQEIGFIVRKSLIDKNPDLVQRIVASHVEAMNKFIGNMDAQVMYEKKYSRFPPNVVEMAERKFLHYDYRTNVADLKAMAKELNQLGWMKRDLSPDVDGIVNLTFLSKATGKPVADLSKW